MSKIDKLKSSIMSGAFSLALSAIVVKILGVIYKVPLSYVLTDEGMGYFNTAYTIYGFFYIICSAGVPKAITCIVRESISENNEVEAYGIYKKTLRIFIPLAAALTCIYMLFSPILSTLIGNPKALITMLVIGPSILFTTVGGVARGYLNAGIKLLPIAVSQLIEAVTKLVLGLLFAYVGRSLGMSLPFLSGFTVLGITIGSLLGSIYLYICSKNGLSRENREQKSFIGSRRLVKKIAKIALPITVSSSILSLSSIIDMAVIMRTLTENGVTSDMANSMYGNYTTLTVPMINLVIAVLTPLAVALLPRLITHHVRGDMKSFTQDLNKSLSITAFLAAPCAFIYHYFAFDVLDILFSSSASALGAQTLTSLSVSVYFLAILTVLNTAHEAIGNLKIPIISVICGAVVKLILGYILITNFKLGILAAPIGTVFSDIIGCIISYIALEAKGVRVSLSVLVIPGIVAAATYGITYFHLYSVGILNKGLASSVVLIVLSSCIYATLLIGLKFALFLLRGSKNKQKKFSEGLFVA